MWLFDLRGRLFDSTVKFSFYFAVTLLGCDLNWVSPVKKILNLNGTVLVT